MPESPLVLAEPSADVGGHLTEGGRSAAIASCLPMLGTYFSSGLQMGMTDVRGVKQDPTSTDDLDDLLVALTLRVTLAAATHLRSLMRQIVRRPNFRYQLMLNDVAGAITGQLDIEEYLRRQTIKEAPVNYPTLTVERANLTPENTLAAYSIAWIVRTLRNCSRHLGVPSEGPDRREAISVVSEFRKFQSIPALSVCAPAVLNVFRLHSEWRLLAAVERRIERGHVRSPDPYRQLAAWVRSSLSGAPVAEPGEVVWRFYDDRFDSKLYELWCLARLADGVGASLGMEIRPPNLLRRSAEPAFRWPSAIGSLELFFQRSIQSVDKTRNARWKRAPGPGSLGGIPDIVVRGTTLALDQKLAIIDPKLRQRDFAPTEELYKLLGYFENYQLGDEGTGGIIYYSTAIDALPLYEYETDAGGAIAAVALNPEALSSVNGPGVKVLVSLALRTLGAGLESLATVGGDPQPASEEDVINHRRSVALAMLKSVATDLGPAGLHPWQNQLEGHFSDATWGSLSGNQKDMMATALYVGQTLGDTADFSGPVIGLCAAAESILHDELVAPVRAVLPTFPSGWISLGHFVGLFTQALGTSTNPAHAEARTLLVSKGCTITDLVPLAGQLATMNRDYRRAAAHRSLVPRRNWVELYRLMFANELPLLPALAEALL